MRLGVEAALVEGRLVPGDVAVDGGRVTAVGLEGIGRGIAAPGFVDLQVNGFAGVDFLGADADGFAAAGEALLETGVTAYLPTLITSEEADLVAALEGVPDTVPGPRILGVHLEGPFLSPTRLGTHRRDGRRDPDHALLDQGIPGIAMWALPLPLRGLAAALGAGVDGLGLRHQSIASFGTRGATAPQSSSYPTVPAAVATSSTGIASPHSVTGMPMRASGTGSRSTVIMSMETRPAVLVMTPSTITGVPVGA